MHATQNPCYYLILNVYIAFVPKEIQYSVAMYLNYAASKPCNASCKVSPMFTIFYYLLHIGWWLQNFCCCHVPFPCEKTTMWGKCWFQSLGLGGCMVHHWSAAVKPNHNGESVSMTFYIDKST